jgi:hypothetical protein
MVSWAADGRVSGYSPLTRGRASDLFHLASNGSVDLGGVTRIQYQAGAVETTQVSISATFLTAVGDFAGDRDKMGAVFYAVSADEWAENYTPTPDEIVAAGSPVATVADFTAVVETKTFTGYLEVPTGGDKFWVLATPAYVTVADPLVPVPYLTSTLGRALSLFRNRQPGAPVITSPPDNVQYSPGGTGAFRFTLTSGDVLTPDDPYGANADIAGFEVQYKAEATDANPYPEWQPLTYVDESGTAKSSWALRTVTGGGVTSSGADDVISSRGMGVSYGGDTVNSRMTIPAGRGHIRCRVFDFGHPSPTTFPPLGGSTSVEDGGFCSATPSTYPAANTSPWSAPHAIEVLPDLLSPRILSPVGGVAQVQGQMVRLIWRHRSTLSVPLPQQGREVRVRPTGGDWTTVFSDEASPDMFVDLFPETPYPLSAGTQYEWQVRSRDSSGAWSDFSPTATFWVVSPPDSGAVIPPLTESILGGSLGCGQHRVFIYRRGGLVRVGEITGVSQVRWGRVRDDMSIAEVTVNNWGPDCGALLASLRTWAHELVIFRDNGHSVDRVWEGPLTLLTYEASTVHLHAKDVVGYLYRRIIRQSPGPTGTSVVSRAASIVQNALAPDDPNVLRFLQVVDGPQNAKQYRNIVPYSRTAFEEIDDMAANAGLDYTAVGRSIVLWGTRNRLGSLPEFRDKDLGATPIVSEYGMRMANRYVISDGYGLHGEAHRLDGDGEDPVYGLVEMLSSTWASDAADGSGSYSQSAADSIVESFNEASEKSISDRYPPPVIVRVPDNTTLHPDLSVSIQHLVPGAVLPLRSTGTLRSVVGLQKIDSISVTEVAGEETVTITLSPFNYEDSDLEPS